MDVEITTHWHGLPCLRVDASFSLFCAEHTLHFLIAIRITNELFAWKRIKDDPGHFDQGEGGCCTNEWGDELNYLRGGHAAEIFERNRNAVGV